MAVFATQGGNKPAATPVAKRTTLSTPTGAAVTGTPSAASTAAITAPLSGTGATGLATILAGLAHDSSGNGVPGGATTVSIGVPSYTVVAPDDSVYVVDGTRLLHVKGGQVTVAYGGEATHRVVGGLAVGPTGKVVLLTYDGLLEITADGSPTRIATLAQLGEGVSPGRQTPLAFDGAGNMYLGNSSRYKVLRRAVDGTMTLVAGNGAFGGSDPKGDGGPATGAPLTAFGALAVTSGGDLLIGEAAGPLRKVSRDGTLSTIAGAGATKLSNDNGTFAGDGTKATDLDLAAISGLTLDAKGRVYIGDSTSSAIVRIDTDGTMTFIAGDQSGTAEPTTSGRPANQTRFVSADSLAFDTSGALLVTEANLIVRIVGVAAAP